MAPVNFRTSLAVGQDGNTDAQSVDLFRNLLDSISGGAIQPTPLVQSASALADVKSGVIELALMSATSPLSGSVAGHLNFTHEFGLEVSEYLSWWYKAKLYGTLANHPRQNVVNALLNDIKAKYNAHCASVVHHNAADAINPCLVADATDLPTSLALANALKGAFNLHRVEPTGPVHATNDTKNVITAPNASDLPTVITLAEDIDTKYRDHILNQLAMPYHTIPDTLNGPASGGEALFQILLDTVPEGIIQMPLVIRAAESGGWFREALTLKKMLEGRYSDGLQMRFRAFGTHQAAMNMIFPNIVTPAVVVGSTELADIFTGNFNGGEFSEPWGEAAPSDPSVGLFPNWPSAGGSIIDALGVQRPHYYIGSYHTPFRHRCLLVNQAWFNGLPTAQQDAVRAAARACALENLVHSYQGNDAIIQSWQNIGVVIHRTLPRDVLDRFRTGLSDAQETITMTDANYAIMLASQRDFMKQNAIRWGSLPDRMWRVARTDYETVLKPDA